MDDRGKGNQGNQGNHLESQNVSTKIPVPPVQSDETPSQNAEETQNGSLRAFIEKHPRIAWLLTLFLATVFFLILLILFRWDVWNIIWSHRAISFSAVSSLIVLPLIRALVDHYTLGKDEKLRPHSSSAGQDTRRGATEKMAGKGEPWLVTAATFIQSVLIWGAGNKLVRTVIVVAVVISFSSFSAHAVYEGWDLHLHFKGIGHFTEDTTEQDPPSTGPSGDNTTGGSAAESSPPPSPEPEQPPEKDLEPKPFLLETNRYYVLTGQEANDLFFLSGSYTITDWLSPAIVKEDEQADPVTYEITDWKSYGAIAEAIKPFIEDLCSQQVPNMFDEIAPGPICNDISDASDLQEEMTNSEELDQIISVRSEVWKDYPKFGIADLLANNMQCYAQKYLDIDGCYETVKYYQAQSIFWSLRSLTFSSADSSERKSILNYISMRYHDIADAAVDGSMDQTRATALYEAFQLLQNIEFLPDRVSTPEQAAELVISAGDAPPSS